MNMIKKITAASAGIGLFAASMVAMPFGALVSADSSTTGGNAAFDVQTEVNCATHTLTAKIMNKTNGEIIPEVTFDNRQPDVRINDHTKAGETGSYDYNYSGNNIPVRVAVAVEGQEAVGLDPLVNCGEPFSLTVTKTSATAVEGMLHNNNSQIAQTVTTQTHIGDKHGEQRVENLAPDETRLVSLPLPTEGVVNPVLANITLNMPSGFQSSYTINLKQPLTLPSPLKE